MKTIITICVETPDAGDVGVYPESLDDKAPEDYKTEEEKQDVVDFRKEFATGVHYAVLDVIGDFILDAYELEEKFMNKLEGNSLLIEDWDMEDYDIKITKTEERVKE
jgi:hypothetical protein